MAKGMSKRAYHKQEMNNVNQTALKIGAVLAAVSLLAIIISFVK